MIEIVSIIMSGLAMILSVYTAIMVFHSESKVDDSAKNMLDLLEAINNSIERVAVSLEKRRD